MFKSTKNPTARIEYVGGPLCGKVTDHPVGPDGFLPSVLHEPPTDQLPATIAIYAADVVRPTTGRGAHRYVFRP